MSKTLVLALIFALSLSAATVSSPDGRIVVAIEVKEKLGPTPRANASTTR